ncbi:SRPBCC family protein [Rhodococcus indonesiensis]|uniref:SRPBCC family protein n=1 Tax=Rhodococcus indonesiensis TaxID=3055869 RepID=UPI0039F6A587
MIHIRHSAVAEVPVDVAFAYLDDHRTVPEWMYGVHRFEPVGSQVNGIGAIFDVTMQIGPKGLDSRLAIVDWELDRRIVLDSIAGFRTSSWWELADLGDGRVRLDVDFAYQLPGGLAGRALGKLVEPVVSTAIRQTEQALRSNLGRVA